MCRLRACFWGQGKRDPITIIMSVAVCYAQESIPSVRVVQLARERGEDELVGVAPHINQACSRDSSHTFSEGIWRHEVEQGE